MTVYVDQIQNWPTTIACFRGGSCHLTADSLDELHELDTFPPNERPSDSESVTGPGSNSR